MSNLLTNSRLACFRSCPRRHEIAYELGIRPDVDGLPLRIGSAFHAALEARDKGQDPEAAIGDRLQDPFDLAMVAAMFSGYCARWVLNDFEPVAAELPFDMPLVNPATGAASSVWRMAGKIDRIVRLPDGRLALQEYKTTSRDFSPGADYWVRLHLDSQLSTYVIAARAMGYAVETVIYDVTRRPSQRPLKATPEESRKYTKTGALYAAQRERDEAPDEYAARVAADMAERPEHYFARIEIARLDQDLADCARDIWIQQQTLRAAQRSGTWYRNPGACFEPHPCTYIGICGSRDLATNTPSGFVRVPDVHPELGGDATASGLADACQVSGQAGTQGV